MWSFSPTPGLGPPFSTLAQHGKGFVAIVQMQLRIRMHHSPLPPMQLGLPVVRAGFKFTARQPIMAQSSTAAELSACTFGQIFADHSFDNLISATCVQLGWLVRLGQPGASEKFLGLHLKDAKRRGYSDVHFSLAKGACPCQVSSGPDQAVPAATPEGAVQSAAKDDKAPTVEPKAGAAVGTEAPTAGPGSAGAGPADDEKPAAGASAGSAGASMHACTHEAGGCFCPCHRLADADEQVRAMHASCGLHRPVSQHGSITARKARAPCKASARCVMQPGLRRRANGP